MCAAPLFRFGKSLLHLANVLSARPAGVNAILRYRCVLPSVSAVHHPRIVSSGSRESVVVSKGYRQAQTNFPVKRLKRVHSFYANQKMIYAGYQAAVPRPKHRRTTLLSVFIAIRRSPLPKRISLVAPAKRVYFCWLAAPLFSGKLSGRQRVPPIFRRPQITRTFRSIRQVAAQPASPSRSLRSKLPQKITRNDTTPASILRLPNTGKAPHPQRTCLRKHQM